MDFGLYWSYDYLAIRETNYNYTLRMLRLVTRLNVIAFRANSVENRDSLG